MDSPSSFRTAESRLSSSPRSSSMEGQSSEGLDELQYRGARVLPYELRHHCLVYLEEQLYASALNLLNNLLVSGTSYPTPSTPTFAPPPAHIALANTLLVHPIHTTRARSSDLAEVSSRALRLLRNILTILGPLNANLQEAYTFRSSSSRGFRLRRSQFERESSDDNGSDEGAITSALANENSLWTRGLDFWHVVGWALNCSVEHPKRWQFWRLWLEHMLDVLDADWKERLRLDNLDKDETQTDPEAEHRMLKECMLLRYMSANGSRSHAVKRVVKAIFADGSSDAMRAYPEVFLNEAKNVQDQSGRKRKREAEMDLDKEQYGDYIEDEELDLGGEAPPDSSQLSQPTPPLSDDEDKERRQMASRLSNPSASLGGPEAMVLRLRLLSLLSRASAFFPDSFTAVQELYTLYYDSIRPLPLPTFALFFAHSAPLHLPPAVLSSLAQVHLHRLTAAARRPNDDLDQDVLARHILPLAAISAAVDDNAKVALLAESLLRLFARSCDLDPDDAALVRGLDAGIAARDARVAQVDGGRRPRRHHHKGPAAPVAAKRSLADDRDRASLSASGRRMRALLHLLQTKRSIPAS
ncbi:MAG: hypothetical protein M1818_006304 [Claussenomyces sp. TS43310]|nr:MAG: hypothetical protein M1818_006304 [Claussenomyces sp. TS43310]